MGGARAPGQGSAAIAAAEPRWLPRRAFGATAPPLTEGTDGVCLSVCSPPRFAHGTGCGECGTQSSVSKILACDSSPVAHHLLCARPSQHSQTYSARGRLCERKSGPGLQNEISMCASVPRSCRAAQELQSTIGRVSDLRVQRTADRSSLKHNRARSKACTRLAECYLLLNW